ncbi:hypothetical protein IWQ60_003905 [Tieghemiomyces parasiticus]|uniref:Uncharacterized protein n=1 Tax=Tieghemiomyces parasiticus TaxID=78921 RepID=A0A9W8A9A6_9FUNG|nr:hypothetical protein IWQ60_003905 [Tieghemiomyces parasiticus]
MIANTSYNIFFQPTAPVPLCTFSKFRDFVDGQCSSDEFYSVCVHSTAEKYTLVTRNIDYIVDNMINLFGEETYFVRHARQVQLLEQTRWTKTLALYIARLRASYEESCDSVKQQLDEMEAESDDLGDRVNTLLEYIQTDIDSIVDGYNSS